MTDTDTPTTVGALPESRQSTPREPRFLTRLVWLLWIVSLGLLALGVRGGGWELSGVVAVDGLTLVMWTVITFVSGIVHSYSRRYMAGSAHMTRFFRRVFAFTLVVSVLVAADHIALFTAAWLAMGLVMASLIGTITGWPQAQAAARLARRAFLASSALLTVGLLTLWWATGATAISGMLETVESLSPTTVWLAAGALLIAAMIQSALLPFHTWLLSSMTAPTPASALMHAGFVNAGGVLLVRFAPVISVDSRILLIVLAVGAASALAGKLLKSVQPDIKRALGCSTVGQMGFMIMQAGLGFFGAAITHLILHGFYKAYQFLSTGDEVAQTAPNAHATEWPGVVGFVVTVVTALAGGVLFAVLTGKGTAVHSGLLLTLFVVLMTLQATRSVVTQSGLPSTVRYGAVPLVFLPAIALYAVVYRGIEMLLADLPLVTAPAELTAVHGLIAGVFLVAYVAIETDAYQHSKRLYVLLLNAAQPPADTMLTSTEEYNEY